MSPRLWLYGLVGLALAGLLGWAGLTVRHWHSEALRVPAIERERDQAVADKGQLERDIKTIQETSNAYQDQLAANRDEDARRRAQPARVVRLCLEPARADVPLPAAGSGPHATASASGELQSAPGPDIGAGLKAITDDADRREADLAAQIEALQQYALRKAGEAPKN